MPMSIGSQSTRRGSAQLDRDELFRLITECNAVLRLEPQCLHTRAVRGHALMKAKQWDGAIRDFSVIIEARSDDVHGLFSRGMALFKSGRVEEAHADFSRVLEINPHHVMARYARAGCYNTEGKFHHAIEEYTIALQHDEMETMSMRGKLPRALGQRDVERASREHPAGKNERSIPEVPVSESPLRRIDTETKREAMPVSPPSEAVNNKPLASKKPLKVVQVKLSLSDLIVPSGAAAVQVTTAGQEKAIAEPTTTVPSTEPRTPTLPTHSQPRSPQPLPTRPSSSVLLTTPAQYAPRSPSSQVIRTTSYRPAQELPAPIDRPVVLQSGAPTQPVRRAVRRVTVAL